MTQRYLRHIPSGIVYAYQDIYAIRPDFEEIIDVESRVVEDTPTQKKARSKKVDPLSVELDAAVDETLVD